MSRSIVLTLAYTLGVLILNQGARFFQTASGISLWYPSAGLYSFLLLQFGVGYAPAIFLPRFLNWWLFDRFEGIPFGTAMLVTLWIALGYTGVAYGLKRYRDFKPDLTQLQDALGLLIGMGMMASLLVALPYVTTLVLSGIISPQQWLLQIGLFWAGDATGVAMLAPLLLVCSNLRKWHSVDPYTAGKRVFRFLVPLGRPWDWLWIVTLLVTAFISWIAYYLPPPETYLEFSYLAFLPILWVAIHYGFPRTTLIILIVNLLVTLLIDAQDRAENPVALQFGLMTLSLTGLLLGAINTAQRRNLRALQFNAQHDDLTGLYNRAWLMDYLYQQVHKQRQQPDQTFALMLIDIDRFKTVNDRFGQLVGDQLLFETAYRLRQQGINPEALSCAPVCRVVRLGVDEFVVLVQGSPTWPDLIRLMNQILQCIDQPFYLNGYEVIVSASLGITHAQDPSQAPEIPLRNADIAMRIAKKRGGNQWEAFDQNLQGATLRRSRLEIDLKRQVLHCLGSPSLELFLAYQPIVALETEQMRGFEALIRWHHPTLGPISPAEFIPIAEDTGLIVPLGYWVLQEACSHLQNWQTQYAQAGLLTIAVNLSQKQMLNPRFDQEVAQVLRQTGLSPQCLKLEITESLLMERKEEGLAMLGRLRMMGVSLSIDDFGTGYSSLSYLSSMQVNTLKIDQSFVRQLDQGQNALSIVQAIIGLAESLNLEVVAEGVETPEQLEALRLLGCQEVQGYLFYRPLERDAIESLLQSNLPTGGV